MPRLTGIILSLTRAGFGMTRVKSTNFNDTRCPNQNSREHLAILEIFFVNVFSTRRGVAIMLTLNPAQAKKKALAKMNLHKNKQQCLTNNLRSGLHMLKTIAASL